MAVTFDRETLASTLEKYVNENYADDFEWLCKHLDTTEEELIVDMISDVLDVWLDAHDDENCEACDSAL